MTDPSLPDGCRYVVGDAADVLEEYEDEAAAVFLDDAWARPQRAQQFGVEYSTHPFNQSQTVRDYVDTSVTTTQILEKCEQALTDGGWLVADCDDWLLPRLVTYLQENWGDVAATYSGGGYRKVGGVTYLSSDGTPDKSTAGMYLSTGGYPVVFAHNGETNRKTSHSARQIADRVSNNYDWGSVKPISPYEEWVEGLVDDGELILIPCAGTAPAALAAERVFENPRYVCVDIESDARESFLERRKVELSDYKQDRL